MNSFSPHFFWVGDREKKGVGKGMFAFREDKVQGGVAFHFILTVL